MPPNLKLPHYNIPQVIKIRSRLNDEIFYQYHGIAFEGQDFDDLVDEVLPILPRVDRPVLYNTMATTAGIVLDEAVVTELTWRIAGNLHYLRKGRSVPPWTQQPFPEWVPMQVESVQPVAREKQADVARPRKEGAYLRLRVLAGLPAGMVIVKFWTTAFVAHFRTEFGFSKYDRRRYQRENFTVNPAINLPYQDIRELGRLRLYGLIDPAKSQSGPGFDQLRCPTTCINWNRAILKKRHRIDYDCPRDWSIECYTCPVGWLNCKAACHAQDFEVETCPQCHKEAWFDKENPSNLCIDCTQGRD